MNDMISPDVLARQLKIVGTRPLRPDGVDKVTGRAQFGADMHLPNMLVGKVLRSPHAHARIKSIDISKAQGLKGVKAVITSADLCDLPSEFVPAGEMMVNFKDMTRSGGSERSRSVAGVGVDRRGLRSAATRHRRGGSDEARRTLAAR
jgi:CO/xanthine dehydrogenase Mo-binding subunit